MIPKINLIIPYFGRFPNYFQLFLNSCRFNPHIHWTILSDVQTKYDYPDNVTCVFMTYEELKKKIQEKFDFEVYLDSPYKLCDLKPAYGYIFSEYNEGYDYWGHCDLDVIYGNIEKFLPDEAFDCPKIFTLGHFTLFKNEEIYNKMFMQDIDGKLYYKIVFSSKESFCFDEDNPYRPNINTIFRNNKISIYNPVVMADIYPPSSNFKLVKEYIIEKRKHSFFLWNKGTLTRYIKNHANIEQEEFMYIHLQKRKMKINLKEDSLDAFKIIPNAFEPLEVPIEQLTLNFNKVRLKYWNWNFFKIKYANLKTKIRRLLK